MWENLEKLKKRSCTAKTINTPAPNEKTKKTDRIVSLFSNILSYKLFNV
jgi:hypothetical protein